MATAGTPSQGLDYIGGKVYVTGTLSLICYTNTGNSLGANTVYADLTQPTVANGYSPLTLTGTWSYAAGIVTYIHPAGPSASPEGFPQWVATGTWSATVNGVAIVDISAAKILHFKDNTVPFVAASAKRFSIDLSTVVS